eukprot:1332909-Amorphochlora_amoeboformis.AAC.1
MQRRHVWEIIRGTGRGGHHEGYQPGEDKKEHGAEKLNLGIQIVMWHLVTRIFARGFRRFRDGFREWALGTKDTTFGVMDRSGRLCKKLCDNIWRD